MNTFFGYTFLLLLKQKRLYLPKIISFRSFTPKTSVWLSPSKTLVQSNSTHVKSHHVSVCVFMCVYERKRVMGLLLLCGIRCALFVCFVSVGKAGPSQSKCGISVRISQNLQQLRHTQYLGIGHGQLTIELFLCVVVCVDACTVIYVVFVCLLSL